MQDIYQLIKDSKYFDSAWYLENYKDVALEGLDPIKHYIACGWTEGRNPCAEFNNDAYLEKYTDTIELKLPPLLHYELYGKIERRSLTGILNPIVIEKKDNTKANNKVIYTCISGDYITLFEHRYKDLNWDYIVFTDNKELLEQKQLGHWQIRALPMSKLEDTKNARFVKIKAHELLQEYSYSVWVDGNIDLLTSTLFDRFEECIQNNTSIAISKHNERDCIYDEAYICKLHAKDEEEDIDRHMQLLVRDKYPKNKGLFNTATIFRSHKSKDCIKLMELWWHMVENYSKRDQLSLCYCAWKLGVKIEDFFTLPTLEMYYDYIQIINAFFYVSLDNEGNTNTRMNINK